MEHRDPIDHTIMSLEDGARKQRVYIESRLRDIEEDSSLLKNHIESLRERQAKYNGSIDKVAAEVRTVTEDAINVLRQHEEMMTEQLVKEKSLYDEALKNELSKLIKKLQLLSKSSRHGKEILQTNDVRKMLEVKHELDVRLRRDFKILRHFSDIRSLSIQ